MCGNEDRAFRAILVVTEIIAHGLFRVALAKTEILQTLISNHKPIINIPPSIPPLSMESGLNPLLLQGLGTFISKVAVSEVVPYS